MKMSKILLAWILLVTISVLETPSANAWSASANIAVSTFGGTGDEQSWSITVDSNGNIYNVGFFSGTVDFDPSEGVAELTSAGGSQDFFVSKLDPSGNYLWAKRFGGLGSDTGKSIAADSNGNILVTGDFQGTVDFDPGAGEASRTANGGSYDFFVLKLSSSGNFVWVNSVGGSGSDSGIVIAVDRDGNSLVTGIFSDVVDFDPSGVDVSLSAQGMGLDIFVSKFDSAGNHLWSNGRGGAGTDIGDAIGVDSSGNVYSSGIFEGTVDFDPSGGVTNLTSDGSNDMFISKFSPAGVFLWAKQFGGSSSDGNTPIFVDSSGNIYASGDFSGTVGFMPGGGVSSLTAAGTKDNFISKLDSSGILIWVKQIGRVGAEAKGARTSVDSSGNVFYTGTFSGTVDFDPGNGVAELTSSGSSQDIFVSKLNSSGAFAWAKRIGGSSSDSGQAIVVDSSGNVYTTGYFNGSVDFDPGVGTADLTSAFGKDIFISKLDSSGNAPLVAVVSAGSTPNSKVASIPSGVTVAAIAKTNELPAIRLNFGGTAPTAVTVAPITNPASPAATPSTFSSSTKIVDIVLTGTFSGSATICLDGNSTDRLYHYTNPAWVELSSQSYVNGQVCGLTTSFSPFAAAPPIPAPAYVAPTPVPYLKTLTIPKMNLKDGKLVCTPGTYNTGYTLDGVIQGSTKANYIPSNFVYNLLINGVAQTSLAITSVSNTVSWNLPNVTSGVLISCSVTVSSNSITNTDKSTDNMSAVSAAMTTQVQEVKSAEATYSEAVSANSKAYQKALTDNRATWRKEIEEIRSNYANTLEAIKAKGGSKAVAETSAALKIRIAAQKKSAADYAASKPAALAAKDAANKSALEAKAASISKANLKYGTFIESIGFGVLLP